MVTRKYIRDYKLSESVTARGGIRTEAVYVGKYYAFEDAALAERAARLLRLAVSLTCSMLMVGACWLTVWRQAGLWPIFAALVLLCRAGNAASEII